MAKLITDTQSQSGADTPTSKVPSNLAALENSWQALFLKDLGAPITATGIAALTYWANSEGTVWANNPLAASGSSAGATKCIAQCGTGSQIMAYDNMADGVAHDVAFLKNNNYLEVVGAFLTAKDNTDGSPNSSGMARIWNNINKSGWCHGCQAGKYPEALYAALGASASQIISDVEKSSKVNLGDIAGAVGSTAGAAAQATGGAVAKAASSWADIIPMLGNLLTDVTKVSFWKRVGLGLLGAILLLIGVWLIAGQTKLGSGIESTAVKAGEVAAVA